LWSDAGHGFTDVMIEMDVDCSDELPSTYNAGRYAATFNQTQKLYLLILRIRLRQN